MKRKILAAFCLISVIMGVLFFRLYSLSSSEALASAANRQGTNFNRLSIARSDLRL